MTRDEKVAVAGRLRADGLTLREIGERMGGYSTSSVNAWLKDPDRSREIARKRSYGGTCETCGHKTCGSLGRERAPRHCLSCSPKVHAIWSPESIIEKVKEWDARYGRPPAAYEWNPALYGRGRISTSRAQEVRERYEADHWPHVSTVQKWFGSWNAGIEAAGFEPLAGNGGGRREQVAA